MKILIYGAGIVGCTYGWLLSDVGHDVTALVWQEKKQDIEKNGIRIHCSDFRGRKQVRDIVFRPKVIDTLFPDNDFEYIIVSTNNLYLDEILLVLKRSAGKAHILFFQNLWIDDFNKIAKYLNAEQYFFGFPFMVGGGRDENTIYSVVSGLKYSHTPIGELSGEITPRLQKLMEAFEQADLKPIYSLQIGHG